VPFSGIPSGPETNLTSDVVRHIVADSLILKTEDSRCNDTLDYARLNLGRDYAIRNRIYVIRKSNDCRDLIRSFSISLISYFLSLLYLDIFILESYLCFLYLVIGELSII
jgi:hypothetical protein